jgi:hypothetical protein
MFWVKLTNSASGSTADYPSRENGPPPVPPTQSLYENTVYQAEPIHSSVLISNNTEMRVAMRAFGLAAHLTATVAKGDE